MNRRDFLKTGIALAASVTAPASLATSQTGIVQSPFSGFWQRTRTLWMARDETGESSMINFWTPADGYLIPGYVEACHILRDVRAGMTVRMDPNLINLLWACQEWMREYGVESPIIVSSGYRTQGTNRGTEGAARNSMHLYGKAADIRVPAVGGKYLSDLAFAFRAGGVGFYQNKGFVHIDTGRTRRW